MPQPSAVAPSDHDGQLLRALVAENERLRSSVTALSDELAAVRAAQSELAASLRLIAPLRRVQERIRLGIQTATEFKDRQRRAGGQFPDEPVNSAQRRADSSPVRGFTQQATPIRAAPIQSTAADALVRLRRLSPEYLGRHPLADRTLRLGAGEELDEPDLHPIRTGCSGRVLVIAHVYYPDLWPALAERIELIPAPVDLVVSLPSGSAEAAADGIVARFPNANLVHLSNRGRDMWPLVRIAQLGLVGDHDAVLKLHTKRSVHRVDGERWRDAMLASLCPKDTDAIRLVLELFRSSSDVGMITAAGASLGHGFWGGNGPLIDALSARSGVQVDPRRVRFPGGSMFWSRPEPLNVLRQTGLTEADFEHEALAIDGTTAHALERFLGALVTVTGKRVIPADLVAGEAAAARLRAPAAMPESNSDLNNRGSNNRGVTEVAPAARHAQS